MSRFKDFEVNKKFKNEENDYGVVFYREKRKLHSPPGYEYKSETNIVPTKHNLVTLREGTLLKMCFKYISHHIDILDSLVGLPEIIGKELFVFMLNNNVLDLESIPISEGGANENIKLNCFVTFNEAFGGNVLRSLSFSSIPKPIPHVSKLLLCFQDVTKLDLSGNLLEDEVLSSFYQLYNLEVLVLKDCGLSDFSLKKMTLPYRLHNTNYETLKVLDIEDNQRVTSASITCIFVFSHLRILNVSGTEVKEKDLPLKKLADLNFTIQNKIDDYTRPVTEGWAKPIIERICKRIEESANPNKRLKSDFYGCKKKKIEEKEVMKNKENILCLVRTTVGSRNDKTPIKSIFSLKKACVPNVITAVKKITEERLYKVRRKNIFENLDDDEDDDIMSLYGR